MFACFHDTTIPDDLIKIILVDQLDLKPYQLKVFCCLFFCLLVFENKDKIVIVMEYASRGDLYDYICDKKRISERETRHFFRQIVSAVHYCHQVRLLSQVITFIRDI